MNEYTFMVTFSVDESVTTKTVQELLEFMLRSYTDPKNQRWITLEERFAFEFKVIEL